MTARRSCPRLIPPNRVTRSGLPFRFRPASKQVLGPSGVVTLAAWRPAILVTVDRCLAARVQHRRQRVPVQGVQPRDVLGEQVVGHDAPVFGSVDLDDVVVVQVLEQRPCQGFPRCRWRAHWALTTSGGTRSAIFPQPARRPG
jgi:hypothetical protein